MTKEHDCSHHEHSVLHTKTISSTFLSEIYNSVNEDGSTSNFQNIVCIKYRTNMRKGTGPGYLLCKGSALGYACCCYSVYNLLSLLGLYLNV